MSYCCYCSLAQVSVGAHSMIKQNYCVYHFQYPGPKCHDIGRGTTMRAGGDVIIFRVELLNIMDRNESMFTDESWCTHGGFILAEHQVLVLTGAGDYG